MIDIIIMKMMIGKKWPIVIIIIMKMMIEIVKKGASLVWLTEWVILGLPSYSSQLLMTIIFGPFFWDNHLKAKFFLFLPTSHDNYFWANFFQDSHLKAKFLGPPFPTPPNFSSQLFLGQFFWGQSFKGQIFGSNSFYSIVQVIVHREMFYSCVQTQRNVMTYHKVDRRKVKIFTTRNCYALLRTGCKA